MYPNIVRLLQPTVLVLRVCGICPSSLRKPYTPISTYMYSTILAMFSMTFYIRGALRDYEVLEGITCFVVQLTGYWTVVTIFALTVSSFVKSKEVIRFFKVMESIQKSLLSLNIRQPASPSTIVQVFGMIILFSPVVVTVIYHILYNPNLKWVLGYATCSMIITGTVCKVTVLLGLVNHKLELLNWHLKDLDQNRPSFLPQPANCHDLSREASLRRKRVVLEGLDTRKLTPERVRAFNVAHLKLHYAYRKLNSVFSVPLLFLYIYTALQTTSNMQNAFCIDTIYSAGHPIINIIDKVLRVLIISTLITATENNFRKSSHFVMNLLNDDRHGESVTKELEAFTKILLHRKTSFTAAGCFNVNLKIITRMVTLLAPVVLFLVQNSNRTTKNQQ